MPGHPTTLDYSRALAVGASGSCLDIFSLFYHFSFLSPSLWKTAQYKGSISTETLSQKAVKSKTTNQPTTFKVQSS